jgi:hypothetical protein
MSMRGYRDNSRPRRNSSATNRDPTRLDSGQIYFQKRMSGETVDWAISMSSSIALGWCISQLLYVTVDPVFLCAIGSWSALSSACSKSRQRPNPMMGVSVQSPVLLDEPSVGGCCLVTLGNRPWIPRPQSSSVTRSQDTAPAIH